MKHRLTLILSALAAVALAADTMTITGVKLTTFIGTDSNITIYDYNQPAGNGWSKTVWENWADVILTNSLSRRENQSGSFSETRWGDGRALMEVTTTRTPTSPFRVSFLRNRTATAIATVEPEGATAGAVGRVRDGLDLFETKPPAFQQGHGTSDRTKVAPQDKIFHRYAGSWTKVNGIHKIDLLVPIGEIRGTSSVTVPGGSSSNALAAVSTSGGRYRIKPSTLTFGTDLYSQWLTGTFNAYGTATGISIEVRNMNNVLLDTASSYSDVGNDFGFDLGQMMILPGFQPVTFKVTFKKTGALNKMMLLTIDPMVGLSGVHVDLKYGDVDGDNEVTAGEVGLILNYLGAQYPQAAFIAPIPGTSLSVSDLDVDGDGAVTLNDYLISLPNIGQVGD